MIYQVILLKFIDAESGSGRKARKKIYQFKTLVIMYVKYESYTWLCDRRLRILGWSQDLCQPTKMIYDCFTYVSKTTRTSEVYNLIAQIQRQPLF